MSVLRGRGQELDGEAGLTSVSAYGLLGGTIEEPTVWPVVHVSPEMVADLHQPRLIISPEYVGQDRRDGLVRLQQPATARRSTHWLAQAVIVALVTAAAVVPLTLMVAHGAPVATGPGGATRAQVHPAATARTPRAATAAPSARSAARQGQSANRAAARSAKAAAAADQRAVRSARASTRAEQRSAAQVARVDRRSEAQAARAARHGPG